MEEEGKIPTLLRLMYGEYAWRAQQEATERMKRWCKAFDEWLEERRANAPYLTDWPLGSVERGGRKTGSNADSMSLRAVQRLKSPRSHLRRRQRSLIRLI